MSQQPAQPDDSRPQNSSAPAKPQRASEAATSGKSVRKVRRPLTEEERQRMRARKAAKAAAQKAGHPSTRSVTDAAQGGRAVPTGAKRPRRIRTEAAGQARSEQPAAGKAPTRKVPAQKAAASKPLSPQPPQSQAAPYEQAGVRSPMPFVVGALVIVFVVLAGIYAFRLLGAPSKATETTSADEVAATVQGAWETSKATTEPAEDAQETDANTKRAGLWGKTEPQDDPHPVEINLMMVGDVLFHYEIRESGLRADGTRNYDHVFAHILGEMEGQDIKVANQETPLAGEELGFSGFPLFNGPQEMGDAEAKAGFNVILKASNHAMDMDYEGITNEQTFWREQHPEVAVLGEVDPEDASTSIDDVYVYEKDGFRVALLNYTYGLNGFEDTRNAISFLEEEHVKATMATAREFADMIVVFPHWGDEYLLVPSEMEHEWADVFVQEGADLIIGGHPHVIQPVELLTSPGGKVVPCYWSVGNFISTSPFESSLVGGIAKATLRKEADGTCAVVAASFVPVVTHLGHTPEDMTTYTLADWTIDLAETNYLYGLMNEQDCTSLTPYWANNFCLSVLGYDFDTTNERLDLLL